MTPHEQANEMLRAAPSVTVATVTVFGFQLSDWVLLLTAIYTLLQIALIVRRLIVARRTSDVADNDPPCAQDCDVARRRRR